MSGLFPTEDEDELWGQLAIAPLQAPMLQDPGANAMASMPVAAQLPAAAPQAAPELDALEALAAAGAPPESKSRDWDRAGLILAMFADAVAGGGLRAGQYAQQLRQIPDEDVENYQLRMGDAYKRAQIQSMLRQGRGADPRELAIREAANKNEETRLGLQGRGIALDEQKFKASSDAATAMRDLESPITQRMRQSAISMGADPAMVAGMTAEDIMKWRPQLGQAINAGRQGAEWDRRQEGRNAEWDRRNDVTNDQVIAKEGRESERNAAAATIPGWRTGNPNKDNAKAARDIVDALGEFDYSAQKLEEIHGKLNGLQAKLGANFNAFLGSDEAAQLLVDANIYHQDLLASGRKLQNMGVPQLYELQMLEKAMPKLDSIDGILNAGRAYKTLSREAQLKSQRRMKVYGYEPDTGPEPAPQGGLGVTSGPVPKLNFNPDDDRDLGVVYE